MAKIENLLDDCLFFTASKTARVITKMAEEEFMMTGLAPNYAFLVNIVNEKGEINRKDIAEYLHMAPSTITRFVDKLESKKLVKRKIVGKNSMISSTKKGLELQPKIDEAWHNLYVRYSEIISYDIGDRLTKELSIIGDKLEEE